MQHAVAMVTVFFCTKLAYIYTVVVGPIYTIKPDFVSC